MGPIATWLLEQAQQESAERAANDDLVAALVLAVSHLDANDDGERMTNNLPKIHTSTERIDQLEAEHKRTRDLVRVCLRRITDVSLSVDDLKPVVAGLEATVSRWTGGQ